MAEITTTKTADDIKRLREILDRLRELGIPEKTLISLNKWIDEEEAKIDGR